MSIALRFTNFLSGDKGLGCREIRELAESIRRPPRPIGWDNQRTGWCAYCGDKVREWNGSRMIWRNRRSWCEGCLRAWRVCSDPLFARAMVFRRDHGICKDCGTDTVAHWDAEYREEITLLVEAIYQGPRVWGWVIPNLGPWELDHEFPLWLVDRSDPTCLRYWGMGNLATRCKTDHKAKTIREAMDRGKTNRLQVKHGTKEPKLRIKDIPF